VSRSRPFHVPSRLNALSGPLLVVAVAAALGACTAYRPELRRSPEQAARSAPPPTEALEFERALVWMVERHPELRALRAEARGVNLRPNDAMLDLGVEVMDERVQPAWIGTDVLSLFGIGPRPAQEALARALRSEVLARHHERVRELTRELATAFARLAELESLVTHVPGLDAGRYAEAGLAARTDLLESRAVAAGWEAERGIVALEMRRQRLALARLVGSGPEHDVAYRAPPLGWPAVPEADALRLLYARHDLQRLALGVEVADREARLAVARQWPNLGVGLGATFDPTNPFGMLEVSLPLGAAAEARASFARRDAAALMLEAGVLDARHEAASERLALEASDAEVRFMEAAWAGRQAAAAAARVRAENDARDLTMAVRMEMEELESARDLREALLMRADARVEAAVAAGWPGPGAKPVVAAPKGQMWGSD
jgi:hypothetical protein